jgi:hypothetical protein
MDHGLVDVHGVFADDVLTISRFRRRSGNGVGRSLAAFPSQLGYLENS